jgi:hypothetical protein
VLEAECEGDSKAMLVSLSLSSFCATLMRSNFLHERSYGSAHRSLLKYRNIRKCTSYHFMQFHVQQCPTSAHLHTIFSFLKHLAINPNQERGLQSIFSTIVTTAKDV